MVHWVLIFTINYGSEYAFDRVMADWLSSREACVEMARETVEDWDQTNIQVMCVPTTEIGL